MTTVITLSPAIKAALERAVEINIDILNDMALENMWLTAKAVRELAEKSDEEIRHTMQKNQTAAYENVEQLVSLQILYSELKSK